MANEYDYEDPKGAGKAVAAAYDALRSNDDEPAADTDALPTYRDDALVGDEDELSTLEDEALADDVGEAVEDWPSSVQNVSEDNPTDDPADDPLISDIDPIGISGIPPETQSTWEGEEVAGDDEGEDEIDSEQSRASDY